MGDSPQKPQYHTIWTTPSESRFRSAKEGWILTRVGCENRSNSTVVTSPWMTKAPSRLRSIVFPWAEGVQWGRVGFNAVWWSNHPPYNGDNWLCYLNCSSPPTTNMSPCICMKSFLFYFFKRFLYVFVHFSGNMVITFSEYKLTQIILWKINDYVVKRKWCHF